MPKNDLNLQQQLDVCRQVAKLVRAKLPIAGELSPATVLDSGSAHGSQGGIENGALSEAEPDTGSSTELQNASPATIVEARIASGKSLADAVAGDDSRDSRILAACIQAGELAGCLDQTLESWSSMHIANSKSSRALQVAMLYPCMLIATTVIALVFVTWLIIPEYQATYALFDQQMPAWLEMLTRIREHYWLIVVVVFLLSIMPLVIWYVRRQQLEPTGLPREPARRSRLQALSTEMAAIMLRGLVPLNKLASLAVQAGGGSSEDAELAFSRLQRQEPISPLTAETSMLLASLHAGLLDADIAATKLHQVAFHYQGSGDIHAQRQARWLPMLVALTVGLVTVLTYVFLIYLPWIWLLRKIIQPTMTTEL